jgi:hypothetical protein
LLDEEQTKLLKLESWFSLHFASGSSLATDTVYLQNLVRESYRMRKDAHLDLLKPFAAQDQTRHHDFKLLYKILCKLGKHVSTTRNLIDSVKTLPQDFNQGFKLRTVASSGFQKVPLSPKKTNVQSIANRMFRTDQERDNFLNRLQSVCDAEELSMCLTGQINMRTRVHAELLLINYFEQHGCGFLDGADKYIGCSKPACYLCHAYISNHPKKYAIPPSHQKVYSIWRLPDINSNEPNYNERMLDHEEILSKMIELIRNALTSEMNSREPRRPYHADSTVDFTSTADPSLSALLAPLSLNTNNESSEELFVLRENDQDGGEIHEVELYSMDKSGVAYYEEECSEDIFVDGGVRLPG